jgi:very-short-patch-repair endonuclease
MTDAHRRVLRIVENLGYRVMDEVSFPPFQVDIYVPDYHAAIEVDGPQHQKGRDAKRDAILFERYFLKVFRVPSDATAERAREYIHANLQDPEVKDTALARFDSAQDEMPWL